MTELEELQKDAARYRWLRDAKCCTISVSKNEGHATNYMTFREYEMLDREWYRGTPEDELNKMRISNTDWCVQIYPNTPIDFNTYNGATLDAAIDAAMEDNGD